MTLRSLLICTMLALILAMAGGVSVKSVAKADATEAPPNA